MPKVWKYVPFGNKVPRGYGLVCYLQDRQEALVAWVPLNLFMRLGLAAWRLIRVPRWIHVRGE